MTWTRPERFLAVPGITNWHILSATREVHDKAVKSLCRAHVICIIHDEQRYITTTADLDTEIVTRLLELGCFIEMDISLKID